jgi:hypothetical protein
MQPIYSGFEWERRILGLEPIGLRDISSHKTTFRENRLLIMRKFAKN